MEISRRRLLQAIAAAPLATIPTIVFGSLDRLPSAREVLANGENITVTCQWNREEMLELAAYCAAFLYVDHKNTSDSDALHAGFDNYIHFMLNNAGPTYTIFGLKAMLTSYQLPIQPGDASSFDRFHKEAGDYVIEAVGAEDGESSTLTDPAMVEEIGLILKEKGYVESRLPI